jgi:spore coat protein U-like protein
MKQRLLPWVFTIAMVAMAAPAIGKDRSCQFQARGLTMSFGVLDPSSGVDATAVVSAATQNADKAGDCDRAVTMTIDGDGGQNGSRMLKNAAGTDFIPYTLVGIPIATAGPGNNAYQPFTFKGVILWSSYADRRAGSYSDTVIISVTP